MSRHRIEDELSSVDDEIRALVARRTSLARQLGELRLAEGGTRLVLDQEVSTVRGYAELGVGGTDLAAVLLRLGRQGQPT